MVKTDLVKSCGCVAPMPLFVSFRLGSVSFLTAPTTALIIARLNLWGANMTNTRNRFGWVLTLGFLFFNSMSFGAVTLFDQNDWKVMLGGFAELDIINDNTRSFTETMGSSPIARPGTLSGENGRTQFSIRNSRIAFTVMAPVVDGWKSKVHLEFDLLGTNNGPTEASLFTSPTMRARHAYFLVENEDWQIIAGQTWTLFGWQTYYMPASVSVAPIAGVVYQRTPQVAVLKKFGELQAAASLSRPTQRDTQLPNLDVGAKYAFEGRKVPFQNSASGEVTLQPMSVAVTSTVRNYESPNGNGISGKTHYAGYGVAVDTMIPILTAEKAEEHGHALLFSGEFTTGQGYGDAFTGWTGNLRPDTSTETSFVPTSLNLDPGIAGFDANGNFQLVKLVTFNLVLQYHLPSEWATRVNVGYARINSSNNNAIGPLTTGAIAYNRAEVIFANVYHDFTKQIRVGLEYAYGRTTYVDAITAQNSRIQVSSWFRL